MSSSYGEELETGPAARSGTAPVPHRSARLLGSIAAEGSPRIGRTAIEKRLRSCTSPQFGSCLENFVIRPKVSGQTLRNVTFKCVISFY